MLLYITDHSGRKLWRTNVAAAYSRGERNNMRHRLAMIKADSAFAAKLGVDRDSARIVMESEYDDSAMTDSELLNLLFE